MSRLQYILTGALALFMNQGCQTQIIKLNIDDPNSTTIQIDDQRPRVSIKKRFEIPEGRDFTLVLDHPSGIERFELDGSFSYIVERKETGAIIYQFEDPKFQRLRLNEAHMRALDSSRRISDFHNRRNLQY